MVDELKVYEVDEVIKFNVNGRNETYSYGRSFVIGKDRETVKSKYKKEIEDDFRKTEFGVFHTTTEVSVRDVEVLGFKISVSPLEQQASDSELD